MKIGEIKEALKDVDKETLIKIGKYLENSNS